MTVVIILAWRNLRRRPLAAVLLLLTLTTVTATLSLGLATRSAAQAPWDRAFSQTNGPQIVANSEDVAALETLTHAPNVTASVGPFPLIPTQGTVAGYTVPLTVIGRPTLATAIDDPRLTAGTADLAGASIVLESSVADAVHAHVGDPMVIAGVTLTVRGIALSVAQPPFPRFEPGLAWISPATATQLSAGRTPRVHQVELQLNHPDAAPAFVTAYSSRQVYVTSWQQTRAAALEDITTIQAILLTVSGLLIILTVTAVSGLVATRISERQRQIATLKTVGATPSQLSAMMLLELGAVATVAIIAGAVVGPRLAIVLTRPSGGLLAAAGSPTPSLAAVLLVAAVGYGIVALACLRGSYSAAHATAIAGLTGGAQRLRGGPRSGRLSAMLHLPVVVQLGTRSLFRRRSRTLLAIISLALAVALGAAALATHRTFEIQLGHTGPTAGNTGAALQAIADRAAAARIRTLVDLFAVAFAVVAVVNLIIAAIFAARDSAPDRAVLRALGFAPLRPQPPSSAARPPPESSLASSVRRWVSAYSTASTP